MFKREKIYKIVYEVSGYRNTERTLLVVAKDPVRGLKKFYELAGSDVKNILEFTEIKSKEEVKTVE